MPGRCGCHGVSFHSRTEAGTLTLGLINAGTLTGTNSYDCVRDNTRRAVAHFSSKAILTLTINKLSLVSGAGADVVGLMSIISDVSMFNVGQFFCTVSTVN